MRREVFPEGFRRFMVGSAIAHVVVVVAVSVGSSFTSRAAVEAPKNFISTKLVKLGKRRDKKLLPRVATQPPPPAPKAVSVTPKAPAPKPRLTPKVVAKTAAPSVKDRMRDMRRVSSALDRLKHSNDAEEAEGDPSGVADGEVTDLSKAIQGNKVATEIYRCIKSNYRIEGMSAAQVSGYEATVLLRVNSDGTFEKSKLSQSSGHARYDAAVMRAVSRCGRITSPPKELREMLSRDGIEIVFKP